MVSPTPGGKDAREGGGKAEWMIYAFVARGTAVLAEYTEFTGNFPAIAAQCLQRLPAGSSSAGTGPDGRGDAPARFSYACDRHTFNFLLYRGYGEIRIRCDQSTPFKLLRLLLVEVGGAIAYSLWGTNDSKTRPAGKDSPRVLY
jgi:hypothetical protein